MHWFQNMRYIILEYPRATQVRALLNDVNKSGSEDYEDKIRIINSQLKSLELWCSWKQSRGNVSENISFFFQRSQSTQA